ncbi:MAG: hypothetical protein QNJ33_06750 [Crocosphaera sp.]|nr:hypothetical protein [Crocosphaera sp.]
MKLTARLTVGWDYKNSSDFTAEKLHKLALNSNNYLQFIANQVTERNIKNVYQLDKLYRRSPKGAKPMKQLLGALSEIKCEQKITCHIDAFAYSFLKGAKNLDLLLPLDKEQYKTFIQTYKNWSIQIADLENFERSGKLINKELKEQYLALRKIVSRPSVRDEIRTLATLLISGPSTLEEVSEDIGLNYTLGQQTVGIFENIEVVRKEQSKYIIVEEALPVVIFCLRETIGLDLLSNLDF